jgi:hypothetical protein
MHKATTPPGNPLPRITFFIGLFRPHAAEDSVFYRWKYNAAGVHQDTLNTSKANDLYRDEVHDSPMIKFRGMRLSQCQLHPNGVGKWRLIL